MKKLDIQRDLQVIQDELDTIRQSVQNILQVQKRAIQGFEQGESHVERVEALKLLKASVDVLEGMEQNGLWQLALYVRLRLQDEGY